MSASSFRNLMNCRLGMVHHNWHNILFYFKNRQTKKNYLRKADRSVRSALWIINRQIDLISQACSTRSRLIEITIGFMFSPQSCTNATDINLHLVCDNKETMNGWCLISPICLATIFLPSWLVEAEGASTSLRTRRLSSSLSLFSWEIRSKVEATKRPHAGIRQSEAAEDVTRVCSYILYPQTCINTHLSVLLWRWHCGKCMWMLLCTQQ